MTVGYLAGSFDLLNVADLDLLEQAREHCSTLVVGVFSDDLAHARSGRRPVVPLAERMALVSRVRGVGEVLVHDDNTRPFAVDRTFAIAGEPAIGSGPLWWLSPRRQTSSPVLRQALARGPSEEVA